MEFGINYSTQAAELVAASHIEIDRFKTPDWPNMIQEALALCRVAVHFELRAGNGKLVKTDWARIERFLKWTGTPYVNVHLDPRIKDFPDYPIDTTDPAQTKEILSQVIEDVQVMVEHLGADRVIGENVPYRGWDDKSFYPAVVPAYINQVLHETGCGLLLDISHARISAHQLGMDERDYMRQLPISRLRELHFTGLHRIGTRLQDHLEVLEADWPVLEWVLERIESGEWPQPWLFVFEYGGVGDKFAGRSETEIIAEQVPRLFELVKKV
jgi:uncharacterized protein (UPF0276 family)